MSKTIEINSDEKIKEIRTNLYTIHQFLLQKVISDEKLFYSKRINDVDDLYKEYRKIKNSPLNLCLRTFRWFNKYGLYLIIIIILFSLVGLFSSYFFQEEVIIFFSKYNINPTYLVKFFNFIENSILYISETYNLLIFKLKSLNFPRGCV